MKVGKKAPVKSITLLFPMAVKSVPKHPSAKLTMHWNRLAETISEVLTTYKSTNEDTLILALRAFLYTGAELCEAYEDISEVKELGINNKDFKSAIKKFRESTCIPTNYLKHQDCEIRAVIVSSKFDNKYFSLGFAIHEPKAGNAVLSAERIHGSENKSFGVIDFIIKALRDLFSIDRELVSRLKKNDVYMKPEEQKIGKILNEIGQFKYYRLPSDLNVGILSVIDIGEKYEFRNKVQHYKIRGSFSVSTKWVADGHTKTVQLPFV
jgi:hypothetical protein